MNTKYCCFRLLSILFLLSFFLTLSGCSNDPSPGPSSGKINVTGKVIDGSGNAIDNATISIEDYIKTSDANGNFSIAEVTSPYDVKIIINNKGTVYKGLTSTSPQLIAFGVSATTNSSSLNVSLPALTAKQEAKVIFTDQTHIQTDDVISFPGTTANLNIEWPGGSSLSGKIIVLIYTIVSGHVTSYEKYGEKSGFTLNNGGTQAVTFSASELTLDPGESNISGTFILPAGFNISRSSVLLKYATTRYYPYTILDFVSTAGFSFEVPTGLPTTSQFVISGDASGSGFRDVSSKRVTTTAPNAGLTIVIETPPSLTTPPNSATNIDTNTNFTYTSGSGTGIYVVTLLESDREFYVITSSTNVKIPNLNSFGLGIGSSLSYQWFSYRYNHIISTDEFVSGYPYALNSSEAISEWRNFTTIP